MKDQSVAKPALQGLRVNHLGIATKSIAATRRVYLQLGFCEVDGRYYEDELQGVRSLFLQLGNTVLELLESLNPQADSPLVSFLKGTSHCIYHVCYQCRNLDAAVEALRKEGFRLLVGPIPGVGFENHNICFLFKREIGVIELLEQPL